MSDVGSRLHKRPGVKRMHTFRSHVADMVAWDGRLIVILANGKAYASNKKHTRWKRIKP